MPSRTTALRISRSLPAPLLALALLAAVAAPGRAAAETHGINPAFMDTTCSPCKNFYQFANGAWIDTVTIPPAYMGIGAGREIYDRNQEALRRVLQQAAANAATTKDPTLRKLGVLYASCMDSARADREGWQPIAAELKSIDAILKPAELWRTFARFEILGLATPFNYQPEADPKQSTLNIAQIYQGGLGMPDRDYYFKDDPKSQATRTEYQAHVARTFQLLGESETAAHADADRVVKLETALAESSMTRVAQRDPDAIYHKMSASALKDLAPTVDWSGYFKAVGNPDLAKAGAQLDVSQPGFVKRLDALMRTTPIEDWRAYLRWQLASAASPWLSKPFFDESFSFLSHLSGAKEPLPRWKRAAATVDQAMGEALGKAYVEQEFPASSKARMLELVDNLQATLGERIASRPWMSEATKKQATIKLGAILKKIGYPDTWRDYSALVVDPAAPAVTNLLNSQEFEARRQRNQIGQKVDRMEWGMSPPTVNAYYNPTNNEIVFPAGILRPPQFDPQADDAVNYGAIGMVIGHEITHGFDDEGRRYDAQGNLKEWWTADDAKKFKERAQRVVDEYDGFVAVDTLHVNGELTLGENIADLGGITIAYYAYQRSLRGKPRPPDIGGFTPEQRFFLGYAQAWRNKLRPEILRLRTLTDEHSPPFYRVIGALSNMPEFAKAFGCKPGDAMVRDESVRAEIW
jgi:predicted metalloendopeptidase